MKNKIIAFLCSLFMIFSISSCSFTADETLEISTLTTKLLDDGTTMVMITYTDETVEPTIFYIPKGDEGEKGETGNGIKEVLYEYDENGDYIVTIKFTDETVEPLVFNLKNGISIEGVTTTTDEETGKVYMTVNFSNGTSSETIELPRGEKGKDGSVIVNYGVTPNEETGGQTLFFIFSTGEIVNVEIPAPQKGEDGRGIAAIVGYEDDNLYYITFYFTDDSEPETVEFTKPQQPNTWLTISSGKGPDSSLGKNGDYCYDTVANAIYHKDGGSWVLLVDFDDVETTHTVKFDVNADDAYLVDGFGFSSSYELTRGSTFYAYTKDTGRLMPVAARPGYKFIGWYSSSELTVNSGQFTDLTPIYSDMTLYAQWSEVN